jgi:hypothetical protein
VWHGRVDIVPKGIDTLVDAWSEVRATCSAPPTLLLVGTGSGAGWLRERIEALGSTTSAAGRVRPRPPDHRHLPLGRRRLRPPLPQEGFPVAPVEAMAAGLPVVATDAPGVRAVVGEGEAAGGVVVAREDAGALAAELRRFLDDPELSAAVGAAAHGVSPRSSPWTPSAGSCGASCSSGPRDRRRADGVRGRPDGGPTGAPRALPAARSSHATHRPTRWSSSTRAAGRRSSSLLAELAARPRCGRVPCDGRGTARAMNRGLAAARHDTVLVTHDDCTVAPGWVGVAARHASAHPEGIITGRVLPPDGSPYVPSTKDDPEPHDYRACSRAACCTGEHGGEPALHPGDRGFDERRSLLVAEDNDLCYRWLAAGRTFRYEPELVVWHHDWRTPEQLVRTHVAYARAQGGFYAKHLRAGRPPRPRAALVGPAQRRPQDRGRDAAADAPLAGALPGDGVVAPSAWWGAGARRAR